LIAWQYLEERDVGAQDAVADGGGETYGVSDLLRRWVSADGGFGQPTKKPRSVPTEIRANESA
jgi:hypothetical protein